MKRVLVTGENGFIGRQLLMQAREPRYCDQVQIIPLNARVDSILNSPATQNSIDCVVHLAGKSVSSQVNASSDYDLYQNTVLAAHAVAAFAAKTKASVIFASSSSVYSEPIDATPVDENAALGSASINAMTKRLSEEILNWSAQQFGFKHLNLRLFNVYGKGQNSKLLIPLLLNSVLAEQPITLRSKQAVRDYVHVKDVCEAILKAVTQTEILPTVETLNIGSGKGVSVDELVRLFESASQKTLNVKVESPKTYREVNAMVSNPSKAKNLLGWQAEIDLKDGIQELLL